MNKYLQMVRDFHDAFNYEQDIGSLPSGKANLSRASFIAEEYAEYLSALASKDRVAQLDALCDAAYFALGTVAIIGYNALEMGLSLQLNIHEAFINQLKAHDEYLNNATITSACSDLYWACAIEADKFADFDGAFAEVQRSNMSKLDADGNPIYRADGKILKSDLFSEPQLEQFIR